MSAAWKKWYREQAGNEDKTPEQVDAAFEARKISQRKERAAKEPKPTPTPPETRAERAARMRQSAEATPSITQEKLTKQKKRRTSTSGGTTPQRESYPEGREGTLEWNRALNAHNSGQGRAIGSAQGRLKGGTQ